MNPPPEYLQHRIDLFEKLKKEADEEIASKETLFVFQDKS